MSSAQGMAAAGDPFTEIAALVFGETQTNLSGTLDSTGDATETPLNAIIYTSHPLEPAPSTSPPLATFTPIPDSATLTPTSNTGLVATPPSPGSHPRKSRPYPEGVTLR